MVCSNASLYRLHLFMLRFAFCRLGVATGILFRCSVLEIDLFPYSECIPASWNALGQDNRDPDLARRTQHSNGGLLSMLYLHQYKSPRRFRVTSGLHDCSNAHRSTTTVSSRYRYQFYTCVGHERLAMLMLNGCYCVPEYFVYSVGTVRLNKHWVLHLTRPLIWN